MKCLQTDYGLKGVSLLGGGVGAGWGVAAGAGAGGVGVGDGVGVGVGVGLGVGAALAAWTAGAVITMRAMEAPMSSLVERVRNLFLFMVG